MLDTGPCDDLAFIAAFSRTPHKHLLEDETVSRARNREGRTREDDLNPEIIVARNNSHLLQVFLPTCDIGLFSPRIAQRARVRVGARAGGKLSIDSVRHCGLLGALSAAV